MAACAPWLWHQPGCALQAPPCYVRCMLPTPHLPCKTQSLQAPPRTHPAVHAPLHMQPPKPPPASVHRTPLHTQTPHCKHAHTHLERRGCAGRHLQAEPQRGHHVDHLGSAAPAPGTLAADHLIQNAAKAVDVDGLHRSTWIGRGGRMVGDVRLWIDLVLLALHAQSCSQTDTAVQDLHQRVPFPVVGSLSFCELPLLSACLLHHAPW